MRRELRLRRPQDFARVRAEGRTYRHPLFFMNVAPNGLPHNRYGFVTAKRIGSAVMRNRARRLMREAVRLFHSNIKQGYDIVLVARPGIASESYTAILNAVKGTLVHAALVNGDAKDD
jgi:ribonuclease P protein component